MGVDYTAKAAYGIPVEVLSKQDADSIDEALPDGLTMIEFGSANYGGEAHYVLGVSVGGCNFARGSGTPERLSPVSYTMEKKIHAAVRKHKLTSLGAIGFYVGGLVW